MSNQPLGIKRLEALHYYVHDLERSRRFYTEQLDFRQVASCGPELERRGRQRSLMFAAGDCCVICSAPKGEGGRAWRYLQHHPDGIGAVVFEVEDARRAFDLLDGRGGTPIDEVERIEDDNGPMETFSITTPFGGTTFRFVQWFGSERRVPGFDYAELDGSGNSLGIGGFDHITSNFETMSPALLWLEHVMGFERYWDIEFHTQDAAEKAGVELSSDRAQTGLRSQVMWDPHSQVKFANNEPLRPFFSASQINLFTRDNRGDGVQHAALAVSDIIAAVTKLRGKGVKFMPTPGTYYDMLPERLRQLGVGEIDEDQQVLRDLEILVDGKGPGSYLLQVFLQDSAATHEQPEAGPFFFEIIQRKGDKGFGGGNFRALFESIERQQQIDGRV